jgi:predicted Fe-Mo cluster-binding NifX family protein
MKVAITCWHDRVSPVLDVASKALLVTLAPGLEAIRQEVSLDGSTALHRAQYVLHLGVDTVICGAVSRPLELALHSLGIEVIANVCGQVDRVLTAFITGQLHEDAYLMPGCCGLRRRMCGGSCESPGRRSRQQKGSERDV